MALYFLVAVVVYANFVEKPLQLVFGLYLFIGVCDYLSLYGLRAGTFFILGLHKNGVADSLACGVIVCTELWLINTKPKVKFAMIASLILITAGLVFTVSRGAWLGALAGFLVVIAYRGKVKFLLQASIILIPVLFVFWSMLPQDQQEYASDFSSTRQNIDARYKSIDYARDLFMTNPVYGVGVGLRKSFDATNIFWVTLAETGIPGLLAFAMIHYVALSMIYRTQKHVPRTDARYTLLVLGGALLFQKLVHGLVDHYWSRGALLLAWASVGMAVNVYFEVKLRLEKESAATRLRKYMGIKGPARAGI